MTDDIRSAGMSPAEKQELVSVVTDILDISMAKQLEIDNPGHIFIAGLISPRRPGAVLFMRLLELRYYPPHNQELNDKYVIGMYQLDDSVVEVIVGIPSEGCAQALALADECHLEMKLGDNLLVSGQEMRRSGITDGRIYVLSNKSDHAMYGKPLVDLTQVFEAEDRLLGLEELQYLNSTNPD